MKDAKKKRKKKEHCNFQREIFVKLKTNTDLSCPKKILLLPNTDPLQQVDRDRMVVGFTTTCAISAYHH